MAEPPLAVVVVTHRSAAHVGDTLRAISEQLRDGDELVVVDNGSPDGTPNVARSAAPRALVLEQRDNIGFAGGCNAGAAASSAPILLFLNPDALPAPGCLAELRRIAVERPGWGAWQALVTMHAETIINSAGNVAHFLGVGWAGGCGEPIARAPSEPTEVGFASGAALVVRRTAWQRLGGFDERYFMYCEDMDLGLRLWLSGSGVGVAPAARVEHDYSFRKGERKWFLLERNRWWTVLSVYPGRLLMLLAPALLAAELAVLLTAARDGWLRTKLSSQAAILRELPQILERRRRVQARRSVSERTFARALSAELDNPNLGGLAKLSLLARLQRTYWTVVVRLLPRRS
jgi:N-acetylglucosaminyl-diphospho-decaprenol L-rhamnosyltransferase